MRFLITGGCGFVGSAAVRILVRAGHQIMNVDKLTYAGDLRTVAEVANSANYRFKKLDILDHRSLATVFTEFEPHKVIHFAAESHVDRSIDDPAAFIDTNLCGTFVMLQTALDYWRQLDAERLARFRFIQVSTDEVFGSLGAKGFFTEETAYQPNSPYSASKAGADHLARAWHSTFGLPTIICNCSNNYGPFQNPEKFIPTVIRKALSDQTIPIYGDGTNVRDWIYVDDHVAALLAVCERGQPGASYNIGGLSEISNLDLARNICALLDRRRPHSDFGRYSDHIQFVVDRPGHDQRYAVDPTKARRELGWQPQESLQTGLAKTVDWYLDRMDWTMQTANAEDRLGLGSSLKLSPQG